MRKSQAPDAVKASGACLCFNGTDQHPTDQQEISNVQVNDIGRCKDAVRTDDLIRNWIRNRNTIEFLGIRERINNPDFKPVEFDGFGKQAGLNSFTMTPKQWIERISTTLVLIPPNSRKLKIRQV
jgi:hypothetical protein